LELNIAYTWTRKRDGKKALGYDVKKNLRRLRMVSFRRRNYMPGSNRVNLLLLAYAPIFKIIIYSL
jgi:hypothetical protein